MNRFDVVSQYYYAKNSRAGYVENFEESNELGIELLLEKLVELPESRFFSSISVSFGRMVDDYGALYSHLLNVKKVKHPVYLNEFVVANIMQSMISLNIIDERVFKNSFAAIFKERGGWLLNLMACHRVDIAQRLYPQLIKGLQLVTSDMWDERRIKPQKLSVLAIEMLASEHNQTIDWGSMGIPIERFYKDFVNEALYTEDETLLSQWLVALCDQHLKWADTSDINPDEDVLFGWEISRSYQYLWPFEYQAVKNFRATKGLSTPMIDHPLLKTPMAIDHRPDLSQWKQPDWFDDVLTKLVALNPELAVIPDLLK